MALSLYRRYYQVYILLNKEKREILETNRFTETKTSRGHLILTIVTKRAKKHCTTNILIGTKEKSKISNTYNYYHLNMK
jgi:hypothetical protein